MKTVKVSPDLHQRLKVLATRRKESLQKFVQRLLEWAVKNEKQ